MGLQILYFAFLWQKCHDGFVVYVWERRKGRERFWTLSSISLFWYVICDMEQVSAELKKKKKTLTHTLLPVIAFFSVTFVETGGHDPKSCGVVLPKVVWHNLDRKLGQHGCSFYIWVMRDPIHFKQSSYDRCL